MMERDVPDRKDSGPLPPPQKKEFYVREMFGAIARRYDLMNRLMTLGRDRHWRRYAVAQLGLGSPALDTDNPKPANRDGTPCAVLDVATGTGDLALEVLLQAPGCTVVGLDFVPQMLALAQQKAAGAQIALPLAGGDALKLPFAEAAFDGVVTGFAMRNVTDIPAAFAEMARVTRPGGRVACLEITKPQAPLFRQFYAWYFYRLVPLLGGWITGQPSAYTYLPHSLTAFLSPDEIAEVMRQTGWREVRYRRLMLGTVAVHVGTRG
jgi:demethylmenaquinone methyltransferase / 2-methoxy-6-polyprenyl-1,4-benzoquinol methylase